MKGDSNSVYMLMVYFCSIVLFEKKEGGREYKGLSCIVSCMCAMLIKRGVAVSLYTTR